MTAAVTAGALAAAGLNLVAAAIGGWCWYRATPWRAFWIALRGAQLAAAAVALAAGVWAAAGGHPSGGLFYLYALLPLAVGLAGEQLRVSSAETILADRGLEGARAVEALPEPEQRSLVLAIMRREVGVMTIAALVVCVLELRAAGTA